MVDVGYRRQSVSWLVGRSVGSNQTTPQDTWVHDDVVVGGVLFLILFSSRSVVEVTVDCTTQRPE